MAERKLARSSLKGYTYQNYVFTLFLAKMDVERKILRIESEAVGTKQFDDLYIKTDDVIGKKLSERGIRCLGKDEAKEGEYIPLKNGYIHEEDEAHIIEKGIQAFEVARYADGWYSCLPFPQLYRIYSQVEVERDYLNILHESLFARVIDREYIGNWNLMIGNIPEFLEVCNVEIDWKRIFDIFKQFLQVSLIYLPEK